jgi:transcriptional regulator with XRE-family HTH domain
MIKQKLIDARKAKNLTQAEFASKLDLNDTSSYNRRESGVIKISKKEWDLMAKELNVNLEDIYEPEDGVYIINNKTASGDYSGSHNHFNGHDEFIFDTMKKYIQKLEEENQILKEKLLAFKK